MVLPDLRGDRVVRAGHHANLASETAARSSAKVTVLKRITILANITSSSTLSILTKCNKLTKISAVALQPRSLTTGTTTHDEALQTRLAHTPSLTTFNFRPHNLSPHPYFCRAGRRPLALQTSNSRS